MAMQRRGQKEECDDRMLGSGSFVSALLKEAEERQLRQMKHKRGGKTIQKIIEEECSGRKISQQELKAGSKRSDVGITRAIIACRRCEELGESAAEIARHLGVTTSCIVRSIAKVAQGQHGVKQ